MLDAARHGDRRRRPHDRRHRRHHPAARLHAPRGAGRQPRHRRPALVGDRAHGRREPGGRHRRHAALAVAAGIATQRARRRRLERLLRVPAQARHARARGAGSTAARSPTPSLDFYLPYGARAAAQFYAWIATRYQQLYGIARRPPPATSRSRSGKHAQRNDKALMRGTPLTMDEYLASRWVAEPFRLLDCCLETDCAAAVVVTHAPSAPRDLAHRPRRHPRRRRRPSVSGRRHREPARPVPHRPERSPRPRAFAMAGVRPTRHRLPRDLRLLHLRRAAAARGARPLRARRGRRVRARRAARARRRACR